MYIYLRIQLIKEAQAAMPWKQFFDSIMLRSGLNSEFLYPFRWLLPFATGVCALAERGADEVPGPVLEGGWAVARVVEEVRREARRGIPAAPGSPVVVVMVCFRGRDNRTPADGIGQLGGPLG